MPFAQLRTVRLCYERAGDPAAPPLLLIAGQSAQLISWPPQFIDRLVKAGFHVITFDNRDVGLSTKCESQPEYDLTDMANDTAGLLDALGVRSAHVVGQSMGGMIAQHLAISHPDHVASLCLIYSAPSPDYITRDPQIWSIRNRAPAPDRESRILRYIEIERISGLEQLSEEWIRCYAETAIDRCYHPQGGDRQMTAIHRSGDRTDLLTCLHLPTAVIHGLDDRLIDVAGGIATAASVPNAELHVYADMGHQLVPSLWPDYVRVIKRTATRARNGGVAAASS
jgi:pimeloyl-ACP methyl ester carboxylesterase